MYFLNEYEIDRAYGGPEEGGWYYDTRHFVKCHGIYHFIFQARVKLAAKSDYLADRRVDLHEPDSVLSEGMWPVMYIERAPGRNYPQTIPHYE